MSSLTVLWIGFCHTGPISLCLGLFVLTCVYFVCFCFILHMCCIIVSTVGWTWWDWSLIFRTVGWVIWLVIAVPDMTYNASGGTLNLAQLQLQLAQSHINVSTVLSSIKAITVFIFVLLCRRCFPVAVYAWCWWPYGAWGITRVTVTDEDVWRC